LFRRAQDPDGNGDYVDPDEGDEAESERHAETFADQLGNPLAPAHQGPAKVKRDQVPQPVAVLDRPVLVEVTFLPPVLNGLLVGLRGLHVPRPHLRPEHLGRIARGHLHDSEGDEGDAEQREGNQQQTLE
jgi:hypothetical protein